MSDPLILFLPACPRDDFTQDHNKGKQKPVKVSRSSGLFKNDNFKVEIHLFWFLFASD